MYKSNFFHPLPDDVIIFSDDNFFGGDSADVDWAQEKNKNKSDWKERQTEDTTWEAVKVTSSIRCHQMLMTRQQGLATGRTSLRLRRSNRFRRSWWSRRSKRSRRFRKSWRSKRSEESRRSERSRMSVCFSGEYLPLRGNVLIILLHLHPPAPHHKSDLPPSSQFQTGDQWNLTLRPPAGIVFELTDLIHTSRSSGKVAAAAAAVAAVWALVSPDHSRHIRRAAAVDSLCSAAAAAKTNI